MKTAHVLIAAALAVGVVMVMKRRTPTALAGGGAAPYFPGEKALPPKLTNWAPQLYARIGGLFAEVAPQAGGNVADVLDVASQNGVKVRSVIDDFFASGFGAGGGGE